METCKREREQFIAIKEKADEEKLAKVQAYARQTLMPFGFTDEELFQVSECIVSLVVHGVVVPTLLLMRKRSQASANTNPLSRMFSSFS